MKAPVIVTVSCAGSPVPSVGAVVCVNVNVPSRAMSGPRPMKLPALSATSAGVQVSGICATTTRPIVLPSTSKEKAWF